jgi:hypothetical protein
MKKQYLFLFAVTIAALSGCGGGNNDSGAAAVPQACGAPGSPGYAGSQNQNCGVNNSNVYGQNNYSDFCSQNNAPYGDAYGWNRSQPCYPSGMNTCLPGQQPVAQGWGGAIVCQPSSYFQQYGMQPYYPNNYSWGNNVSGRGPISTCNPQFGSIQCGYTGWYCQPLGNGANIGQCVPPTGY